MNKSVRDKALYQGYPCI